MQPTPSPAPLSSLGTTQLSVSRTAQILLPLLWVIYNEHHVHAQRPPTPAISFERRNSRNTFKVSFGWVSLIDRGGSLKRWHRSRSQTLMRHRLDSTLTAHQRKDHYRHTWDHSAVLFRSQSGLSGGKELLGSPARNSLFQDIVAHVYLLVRQRMVGKW
ncbi:hypothetical protein DFH08DRAFT_895360 [Mycena albidolilacea]|uniref:Uncharacterized protein n=1 Tax=Mycena albidolilacea TaxID=1033008 RepID=A0AAD6ZA28_9AGAR|nr:hypothetical protein DFH08DRAFT_895360 [Mycena albidolilacea]